MDQLSGVSNNDVATLALAGRSYGYGHGHGGHGNFVGDGSAVSAEVMGNRDLAITQSISEQSQAQSIQAQLGQGFASAASGAQIMNQFQTDRINALSNEGRFDNLSRQHASSERQNIANFALLTAQLNAQKADTDRTLTAMQLQQTECCCEHKAALAAVDAKIDANAALSAKDAQIAQLNMQLLMSGNDRGNNGNNGS